MIVCEKVLHLRCTGQPGRRQADAPTNHARAVSRGVSLPAPWEVGVAWLDAKNEPHPQHSRLLYLLLSSAILYCNTATLMIVFCHRE